MTKKYTWKLENVEDKPNAREGRTAVLRCYDEGNDLLGWCYVEGWLYGCALMGLSSISSLASVPSDAFDSFKDFLLKLSVTLNVDDESGYNQYKAKRYMFTIASASMSGSGVAARLIEASDKITEFKNWAHSSSMNKMYFLNLG